jgi:transcription elongation factor Elf1
MDAPLTRYCGFCDLRIEAKMAMLKNPIQNGTIFIHKNCAIAFAAQVQNEFEKIDAAAKISSSDYSQT